MSQKQCNEGHGHEIQKNLHGYCANYTVGAGFC